VEGAQGAQGAQGLNDFSIKSISSQTHPPDFQKKMFWPCAPSTFTFSL